MPCATCVPGPSIQYGITAKARLPSFSSLNPKPWLQNININEPNWSLRLISNESITFSSTHVLSRSLMRAHPPPLQAMGYNFLICCCYAQCCPCCAACQQRAEVAKKHAKVPRQPKPNPPRSSSQLTP